MNYDSIIFDLDGTLWNAIEGACGAWDEVLAKYQDITIKITSKDMEKCMGLPINEIGKKLFPDLDEEFRMKLMKEYCATEQVYLAEHGGMIFPKVEDTLKKLVGKHKLFIVSNCQDGYIQCFFQAHKLSGYFTDFECSGVTGLSKGDNIKIIIERNALKDPVYVGDTNGDALSAKAAGIPFVFARYGFGSAEEYDYGIHCFEELLTQINPENVLKRLRLIHLKDNKREMK